MNIYPQMHLNVEDLDSRWERLLILIMPAILLHADPGQDSLSIWIVILSTGLQIIRPVLRQVILPQNSLQWRIVVNTTVGFDTSSGWWEYHVNSQPMFMSITSLFSSTLLNLFQCWIINIVRLLTILSVKALPKTNGELPTSLLMIIMLIFWQNHSL